MKIICVFALVIRIRSLCYNFILVEKFSIKNILLVCSTFLSTFHGDENSKQGLTPLFVVLIVREIVIAEIVHISANIATRT